MWPGQMWCAKAGLNLIENGTIALRPRKSCDHKFQSSRGSCQNHLGKNGDSDTERDEIREAHQPTASIPTRTRLSNTLGVCNFRSTSNACPEHTDLNRIQPRR